MDVGSWSLELKFPNGTLVPIFVNPWLWKKLKYSSLLLFSQHPIKSLAVRGLIILDELLVTGKISDGGDGDPIA